MTRRVMANMTLSAQPERTDAHAGQWRAAVNLSTSLLVICCHGSFHLQVIITFIWKKRNENPYGRA